MPVSTLNEILGTAQSHHDAATNLLGRLNLAAPAREELTGPATDVGVSRADADAMARSAVAHYELAAHRLDQVVAQLRMAGERIKRLTDLAEQASHTRS